MARCYRDWLQETTDSGHALVSRLDAASRKDPALGGVHALMRGFQVDVAASTDDPKLSSTDRRQAMDTPPGSSYCVAVRTPMA